MPTAMPSTTSAAPPNTKKLFLHEQASFADQVVEGMLFLSGTHVTAKRCLFRRCTFRNATLDTTDCSFQACSMLRGVVGLTRREVLCIPGLRIIGVNDQITWDVVSANYPLAEAPYTERDIAWLSYLPAYDRTRILHWLNTPSDQPPPPEQSSE